MQVQEILTAAIVFLPACYAFYIAVQFASGLTRLGSRSIAPAIAPLAKPSQREIVATESKSTATEHAAEVTPVPAAMASAQAEVASSEAEPAKSVCEIDVVIIPEVLYHKSHTHFEVGRNQPIALLPAFIPAVQIETTAEDHALVESAWMRLYCNTALSNVVVPFKRPVRTVQKPQQAHPAIEGMSLRKMRELGATLKIRGARRWNTAEAIEALTAYYQARAAA